MTKIKTIAAAIALGLAGISAVSSEPAVAQERLHNPAGIWIHENSGAIFPRFLGGAERVTITKFVDDGSDVGISYNMRNGDDNLHLSVYVYPKLAGIDCKQTYEGAKASVEQYGGAALVTESRKTSPSGVGSGSAYYASYSIPAGAMRPDMPELVSDLYLYCSPSTNWLVKYRASWTGSANDMPDIGSLLQQVGWPDGLD